MPSQRNDCYVVSDGVKANERYAQGLIESRGLRSAGEWRECSGDECEANIYSKTYAERADLFV